MMCRKLTGGLCSWPVARALQCLLLGPLVANGQVIDFESAITGGCQVSSGGSIEGFTLGAVTPISGGGFNSSTSCTSIAPTANSGQNYMVNFNSKIAVFTKDVGTFDLFSLFAHADSRVGDTTVRFQGLDGVGGNVLYSMDVIVSASWQEIFFPGWNDVKTFTWDSVVPDSSNIAIDDFQYDVVVDVVVEVALSIDIKPGSCPNPLNAASRGYLPISILGSAAFDAMAVDLNTVVLSRADGIGGSVLPAEGRRGPRSVLEDTGTPFGGELCDCHALKGDGIDDLSMKFKTQVVVDALELDLEARGTVLELVVSGNLLDGTPFVLSDCIVIVGGRR